MRILIVGAGPTGLTAAVELARQGIRAEVIDKKAEPSTLSRAVGILPASLKTLTPSGVTERLLAEGIKIREIEVFKGQRPLIRLSLRGGHPECDYLVALAQDRTEAILRDVLVKHGGSVRYGAEFAELQQEQERVVVHTKDGVEGEYDYVIGADGAHSTTRQCLGVDFNGYELPKTWSIADVDAIDWPNAELFTLFMLSEGRVAVVVPLERDRYRVISNTEDALATLPIELKVQHIRRQGTFRIAIRQVSQYAVGRVYLAGDAAHCHSPVGGRGMNLGIADAAELTSRLVEGRLDGYSASRHEAGAKIIADSERARRRFTSANFFTRTTTSFGLRLVKMLPPLQRRLARTFLGG